jgi:hypothetical protein
MSRVHLSVVAGLLTVAACSEAPPLAPEPEPPALAKAARSPVVEFRKARLRPDGELVVALRIRCPSGYQVLEEPFTVVQGDVTGSGFSGGSCDDHWDRRAVLVFRDNPEGPGFQAGTVSVRGFFAFENPETGDLLSAQAEETFVLR